MKPLAALLAALTVGLLTTLLFADETSTDDKLRILYSNRFTFDDHGTPLVTVEISSGQPQLVISSKQPIIVQPDGAGASEIHAGKRWTVRVDDPSPARIREWTVVARHDPDDEPLISATTKHWRALGYKPRRFEIGTIFGVDGEVIDSRRTLIAIAPTAAPNGGKSAHAIARKHDVKTSVHRELVARPRGTITASDGSVTITNPSVIWFSPKREQHTLTVHDVIAGGGGSQLETHRETRRYFGSIYVTIGTDGNLTAVNAVPADKLLAGLVPAEIYPDAPFDALAAQAIAARTELLEKIGNRHLTDPFLLCSTQHCQVYAGAGKEHKNTTRAVRRTRGLVMLRPSGGLVDARYSAACGGHSEHNDHIWGGHPDPSLRGRLDNAHRDTSRFKAGITHSNIEDFLLLDSQHAYCGDTRFSRGRYRWSKQIDAITLTKRVAEHYPKVGRVIALEPLERGISGRISRLRIRGDRGEVVATGDLHLRRMLGGLRSSLFVVDPQGSRSRPQGFVFRGAGFGHGVGMCQLGAIGMAENSRQYAEILNHYYPDSRIKRLY